MRRRVLIVDDEPDFLETVQAVLSGIKLEVTAVNNGRAAIEALRARPYDLVITDLRMPGLSGADIMPALRAIDPKVPVVIATGCSEEEASRSAQAQGVRALLYKPFDVAELIAVVNRAFADPGPQLG